MKWLTRWYSPSRRASVVAGEAIKAKDFVFVSFAKYIQKEEESNREEKRLLLEITPYGETACVSIPINLAQVQSMGQQIKRLIDEMEAETKASNNG